MTDRPSDLDDARLHADLATWFESEVRQADLDLRLAPLRPARARAMAGSPGSRTVAGPAAALLVVILVAAGISRLPALTAPISEPTASGPSGSASSEPSTTAGASATATPEAAISIGRRYGDGIPQVIDGELVLRIGAVKSLAPTDDSAFLIGGWSWNFQSLVYACALMFIPPPDFGPRCGGPFLADVPIIGEGPRLAIEDWTPEIPAGPVVLRVHRNDARATRCPVETRELCEATAVIESVVWAGDDVTATAPLSPIDVFTRLTGADPNLSVAALTLEGEPDPIATEPPRGVYGICRQRTVPLMAWSIVGAQISYVLVFSTIEARAAVQAEFGPSGLDCIIVVGGAVVNEWVAVDNVMVAVQVSVDGPTTAEARFVADVREALEHE
jgi:hypothetical protein